MSKSSNNSKQNNTGHSQAHQEIHRQFLAQSWNNSWISILIVFLALGMGVIRYHVTEGLSWMDSLLNASMILGGMGPVDPIKTNGGKLFASFYALFSGLLFVGLVGLFIAPIFHRAVRFFHQDLQEVQDRHE